MYKIIPFIFLLIITVYAKDDTKKEEGIVDKTHKAVVDNLNENIDVLPETLQDKAKGLVKDIETDGKNIGFEFKLINTQLNNFVEDGFVLETLDHSTLFASLAVNLLPNTWNITLSYSGKISEDEIFIYPGGKQNIDDYNKLKNQTDPSTYAIDKGNQDTSWFDFYMKPISTSYGDIGVGYKNIKGSEEFGGYAITVLDSPNVTNTGALLLNGNKRYIRHNIELERFYFTYNIPNQDSWYDGLGLFYGYESSNHFYLHSNTDIANKMVYEPDITSNIFMLGINKTFSEIKSGFNLKKFMVGQISREIKYYNYESSKNDSFNDDATTFAIEPIYMFGSKNGTRFYISIEMYSSSGQYMTREEEKFEIGMLF